MAVTKKFKVYCKGTDKVKSFTDDFSRGNDVRILHLSFKDETGTDEYVIIEITRNTEKECIEEMEGQYSDGFFENSDCHGWEEI